MKKPVCVLTALLAICAPLSTANGKSGSSGSRKSSIIRINPSSGSKSSSGTRKKSSGTGKKSTDRLDSSPHTRKPGNVRGQTDPVYVEGHTTKKGTYVMPHLRGAPDGDRSNNQKPFSGLNRPRKRDNN
jgi:hypothetical protein